MGPIHLWCFLCLLLGEDPPQSNNSTQVRLLFCVCHLLHASIIRFVFTLAKLLPGVVNFDLK